VTAIRGGLRRHKTKVLDIINTAASAREILLNRVSAINQDPGFENWVVCGPGRHTEILEKAGIQVHVIDSPRGVSLRYVSPGLVVSAWLGLLRFIRREKFSIVHTHASVQGVIGRLAAWIAGVPVIIHTEHGSIFFDDQTVAANKMYMRIERFMARFTNHLLYQNPFELEYALRHNLTAAAQVHFVGNGIDLTRFDRRKLERKRAASHFHEAEDPADADDAGGRAARSRIVIVSVTRLDPIKNVAMLLRAAHTLRGLRTHWKLWIVGDGMSRADLEQFVASRDMGSYVRFLGYRDDVPDVLAQAHIAVLTSLKEGLPRGLMEPMAMGLPVVATDVKGNREVVVDGEVGFLVPLDEHVALAQRLAQLIDDEDLRLRMGQTGYRRAREKFDERKVIGRLLQIYRGACPTVTAAGGDVASSSVLA
jgi:glycosyltransferase involved in cell wall biosynthesis